MNINDFRYMRRGKPLQALSLEDKGLLEPIDLRGEGQGRALLLLHGFSSSPAVFRRLVPELISMYGRVVAPTLPGHGESIDAFSKVKAQEWLSLAEQVFHMLKTEHQHIDVLGLSLGGLLALHLSKQESIDHLYLLAPALALNMNINRTLKWVRLLHWLGFERFRAQAGNLFSEVHGEIAYRQLPLATILELLTLIKTFDFVPPTCPTSLFLGCHDEVVDSKAVAHYFETCPNTDIHWLEHSAHVIPLENDTETILACMQQNIQTTQLRLPA